MFFFQSIVLTLHSKNLNDSVTRKRQICFYVRTSCFILLYDNHQVTIKPEKDSQ